MKAKENEITLYDEATLKLKNKLKDFFNTTELSGNDINKVTKLSRQNLSDIKAFLNDKPGKKFSAEKIRNVLADLYKAGMIK